MHEWGPSAHVFLASTAPVERLGLPIRDLQRIEQTAGDLRVDQLTQVIDDIVLLVVFVHRASERWDGGLLAKSVRAIPISRFLSPWSAQG